jgi:hypothetical protein
MDETKKLKVVMVRPGQFATIEEIGSDLESLQKAVGGHIEQVCPWNDEVALICNEDGKNEDLMLNRAIYDKDDNILDVIAGPFFIVGLGEENFRSLTNNEIEKYYNEFRKPEFWLNN